MYNFCYLCSLQFRILIWSHFFAVRGHNGLILGFKRGSDIVLGFTHIAEQCLFSILLSYPILNQPEFGGPIGGFGKVQTLFWGVLI